jgi:hypothetical protein
VPLQRLIRWAHAAVFLQVHGPARSWTVLAWISVVAASVLMTMPWNFTAPGWQWGFDQAPERADLRRLVVFALVGLLTAGALRSRGGRRVGVLVVTTLLVGALGAALEAAQTVIGAHTCSARDALVALLGAGVGACAAVGLLTSVKPPERFVDNGEERRCRRRSPRIKDERLRAAVFGGLMVALGYALVSGLWGVETFATGDVEPTIRWLPFQAHFHAPFVASVADIVEQVALYATITLLCLFLTRGRGPAIALLLLWGLLITLEVGRAVLAEQAADTTAPLLAALAWALTVRVWRGLYPRHAQQMLPARAVDAGT